MIVIMWAAYGNKLVTAGSSAHNLQNILPSNPFSNIFEVSFSLPIKTKYFLASAAEIKGLVTKLAGFWIIFG